MHPSFQSRRIFFLSLSFSFSNFSTRVLARITGSTREMVEQVVLERCVCYLEAYRGMMVSSWFGEEEPRTCL